jgi:hypothetical protein
VTHLRIRVRKTPARTRPLCACVDVLRVFDISGLVPVFDSGLTPAVESRLHPRIAVSRSGVKPVRGERMAGRTRSRPHN